MKMLKNKDFWIGVIVGAVVVPYAAGKVGKKVPAVPSQ